MTFKNFLKLQSKIRLFLHELELKLVIEIQYLIHCVTVHLFLIGAYMIPPTVITTQVDVLNTSLF